MPGMRKLAVWAAAAVLCAATLVGQTADSSADPVFRSETRLVEVTVIARDGHGRPVTDLRPDEIRLLDDGQEQTVEHFQPAGSFIAASGDAQQAAARHSIIVLDALHTDLSDRARVKRALTNLFRKLTLEQDRVAVWVIGEYATRLHDFADDSRNLQSLVADLDAKTSRDGPAGALIRALDKGAPYRYSFDESAAMQSLASLSFIAEANSQIPGQKNLIWISSAFRLNTWPAEPSGGLPLDEGPFGRSPIEYEYYPGYRERLLTSPIRAPVGETKLSAAARRNGGGSFRLRRAVELMSRKLNAANVNLYPVDAAGLSVNGNAGRHTVALKQLAKKTGGKAFYNRNDIDGLVEAALDDTRSGYVLSYSPSDRADDGKPRSIKIETTRRGVTLQYRRSYYVTGRYDPRDAHRRKGKGK